GGGGGGGGLAGGGRPGRGDRYSRLGQGIRCRAGWEYRAGRERRSRRDGRGDRMSLDQISLEGLRVFARHGVLEHEQRDGQEFVIDAVLWLDTRPAADGDDLSLTVDYG